MFKIIRNFLKIQIEILKICKFVDLRVEFTFFENLDYGNHGLEKVKEKVLAAIKAKKKIALYADYDVDGTMSCVSWIWFLRSIGYHNFTHYIPDRFKEGYGLNLTAVKQLVENEKAELIIRNNNSN